MLKALFFCIKGKTTFQEEKQNIRHSQVNLLLRRALCVFNSDVLELKEVARKRKDS